ARPPLGRYSPMAQHARPPLRPRPVRLTLEPLEDRLLLAAPAGLSNQTPSDAVTGTGTAGAEAAARDYPQTGGDARGDRYTAPAAPSHDPAGGTASGGVASPSHTGPDYRPWNGSPASYNTPGHEPQAYADHSGTAAEPDEASEYRARAATSRSESPPASQASP